MKAKTVTALLVALLALTAVVFMRLLAADIDAQTERAALIAAIWRHVGTGVALLPILIGAPLFLLWSAGGLGAGAGLLRRAAKWTLWLAAAMILFQAATGPLIVWTHGSDLKVFDWFVVANPVGKQEALHDILEACHGANGAAAPFVGGLALLLSLAAAARRAKA